MRKPEFIIERNSLNNHWMVYSKCEQLSQCYSFKDKREAVNCQNDLNKQVELDLPGWRSIGGRITFSK